VALPSPTVLTDADWADPATLEMYECALVRMEGTLTVTNADLGFGEWELNSAARVDDLFYTEAVGLYDTYTAVQGPLYSSFSTYKITPRDASDLEGWVPYEEPCLADLCLADIPVGGLVITEIMANPDNAATCTDPNGEYFEVYNASGFSVDVAGLVIEDNAGSYTVSASTVIAAGDYAWFARDDASFCYAATGTPDVAYTSLALGNSGDNIDLIGTDASGVAFTIDTVTYTAASKGVAYGLGAAFLNATDNDTWSNWCAQTGSLSGTTDFGSPGAANDGGC
jgi:hypothetical protein